MSKVNLIGVLVGLAFAASVYAEHDGDWWLNQPVGIKVGYVIGCMDHVQASNPDWSPNFRRVPTFNEVSARLDLFYAVPENRAVPVMAALPALLAQLAQPASK